MSDHVDVRGADPLSGHCSERPAPSFASLPPARSRRKRGGPELCAINVYLEIVTPVLGGSAETREIDEVDIVRGPTVRGHLRFWWRALNAHLWESPQDLYAQEAALWGRAATDTGGRSSVDLQIDVEHAGELDRSDIRLYDSRNGGATAGAYALWPARAERRSGTPPAPRRLPGTRFRLTLAAPKDREGEVRNAVRAWILFGGYGSRTRRGLGSVRVLDDPRNWLPRKPTREAITALFERDVLASPERTVHDVPWLGGGSLHVGRAEPDPMRAWTAALDWLKTFRQGTAGTPGTGAREPGTGKSQPQRPSISNWPEADKVRHLSVPHRGLPWAHPPRHNAEPAWPRAGFGLPIIGQFQQQSRTPRPFDQKGPPNLCWPELSPPTTEPDAFELRWRSANQEHERLASPLIVKALALANGTFVPSALWLNRANPDGEVFLRGIDDSGAPFDRLVADGDEPHFSALANKQSLREAFLDWLRARYQTTVVAP